jgi:alkylhydroperoxidase family enzyme
VTPRIPPLPPDERDDEVAQLLASMRIGGGELNIFATLARHPELFRRWATFGGTLLLGGTLAPRDRELLILRTAWLCRAEYEWRQHVAIALAAGVTQDEVDRIGTGAAGEAEGGAGAGAAGGWSDDDAALLRAADELHTGSVISDETWDRLAARLDQRQLIEVCMLVGQYHLVAFTVNSLGVEPEPGLPPFPSG